MDIKRWTKLMSLFGLSDNTDTYHALAQAYSEKHRAYHTGVHIKACLEHLDKVRSLAEHQAYRNPYPHHQRPHKRRDDRPAPYAGY